jgi:hypothetical protein
MFVYMEVFYTKCAQNSVYPKIMHSIWTFGFFSHLDKRLIQWCDFAALTFVAPTFAAKIFDVRNRMIFRNITKKKLVFFAEHLDIKLVRVCLNFSYNLLTVVWHNKFLLRF